MAHNSLNLSFFKTQRFTNYNPKFVYPDAHQVSVISTNNTTTPGLGVGGLRKCLGMKEWTEGDLGSLRA